MTASPLLAAVTGAVTAAGLAAIAAYAAGYAPVPRLIPPRWRTAAGNWGVTSRQAAAAVAAGLTAFAVTGWPVAGLAAAPAVIAMPRLLSRREAKARIATLEALESWTRRLAEVLAASRGLEDALTRSAGSAPPAIAGPVQALAARMQSRAMTTSEALTAFAGAIGDPVGDLIASALMLAAENRGPGLRPVLAELADAVARDVTGQREVEAERANSRSQLRWIVGFLAVFVAVMVADRPYSAPYRTPAGQFVLAVVAALLAGGLYWFQRLGKYTGPQRFLRKSDGSANSGRSGLRADPEREGGRP